MAFIGLLASLSILASVPSDAATRLLPIVDTSPARPKVIVRPMVEKMPTQLDQGQRLTQPIDAATLSKWNDDCKSDDVEVRAKALIRLGEIDLGLKRDPFAAETKFSEVLRLRPVDRSAVSLAHFDRAMAFFYSGRYKAAQRELDDLIHDNHSVINPKVLAIWERKAFACAAYHEEHAKAGIRQPAFSDPMAGAASVAIALDKLGKPYKRSDIEQNVPHTGLGSSLRDIDKGASSFGLRAVPFTLKTPELLIDTLKENNGMPVVVLVERDHYVTAVKADKSGVTYMCTDCGPWPGGELEVTWKQWRLMDPGPYAALSKPDGSLVKALEGLTDLSSVEYWLRAWKSLDARSVAAAVAVKPDIAGKLSKGIEAAEGSLAFQYPHRLQGPHCVPCDPCPMQGCGNFVRSAGHMGGTFALPVAAKNGNLCEDPVNLASGEEEYKPGPDLVVYNPIGPGVVWQRSYYSLMDYDSSFGMGWTHPYNYMVFPPYEINDVWYDGMIVYPNYATVALYNPSEMTPDEANGSVAIFARDGRPIYGSWNTDDSIDIVFGDYSHFHSETIGMRRPQKWYDSFGRYIQFEYDDFDPGDTRSNVRRLTAIKDSSGNALLTLDLDGYGNAESATDKDGRIVYYNVADYPCTGTGSDSSVSWELDQVSQMQSGSTGSPPARYVYGYTNYQAGTSSYTVPYLSSLTGPTPTGAVDGSGHLLTETLEINYLAGGKVDNIIDANGNKTQFTYNVDSQPKTLVEISDGTNSPVYTYFAKYYGNMMISGVYDPDGNPVIEYPSYSSTASYRPTQVKKHYSNAGGGLTRTWEYDWDSHGRLTESTTPSGIVTQYDWNLESDSSDDLCLLGRLNKVQTHQGSTYQTATNFTYYSAGTNQISGPLHEVLSPIPGQSGTSSQQTTTITYTSLGNVATVTSPGNNAVSTHVVSYGYTTDGSHSQSERLGEPITVTTNVSSSTDTTQHLRWDGRHHVTNSIDPTGIETTMSYYYWGQPDTVTLPVQTTGSNHGTRKSTYLWPNGPLKKVEAFGPGHSTADRTVYYSYGKEGHLAGVTGDAEESAYTYDPVYRTKTFKDGNDNETEYFYAAKGMLTKVEYPGASTGSFDKITYDSFDLQGQVLSLTDGLGQVRTFTYGASSADDGLLSKVAYTGLSGKDVEVDYDVFDRPSKLWDSTGAAPNSGRTNPTASWTYDDLGNVMQGFRDYGGPSVNPPAVTSDHSYYADGSRSEMELTVNTTSVGTWTYGYDGNGNCTSLHSPADVSSTGLSVSYYDNGWEQTRTLPNGCYTENTWDNLGLPYSVTNKSSGGTVRSAYDTFGWDDALNLTSRVASTHVATDFKGTYSWTYGAKDRMTAEQYTKYPSGGGISYTQSFAFDDAGNPTTFRGASQSFNSDNQRSATGYAFDGNGSPTTYAGATFGWDEALRLVTITNGSQYRWYGYRSDGLRAWKDSATGTSPSGNNPTTTARYFYYDGGEPVLETDVNGSVIGINVFAPDGLVARYNGSSWKYFQFDQQGSVVHHLDASGNVSSSQMYEAYGQFIAVPGVLGVADCFRWNGRWGYYYDSETGMYLCGHRYLEPSQGRWLKRDPVSYLGGANLYAYCNGSPVNMIDPNGFWRFCIGAGGVGGIGPIGIWANAEVCLDGRGHIGGDVSFGGGLGLGAGGSIGPGVGFGNGDNSSGTADSTVTIAGFAGEGPGGNVILDFDCNGAFPIGFSAGGGHIGPSVGGGIYAGKTRYWSADWGALPWLKPKATPGVLP
ncbi:MAG: hypothetical protein JST30_01430 [Armatimonadetes bacterium]|nr:hypothetical protein [Armatimonadota bacterium]